MLDGLSTIALVGVFLAAVVAIWVSGVALARQTDVLATRLGLGTALGGVILLAIATNLPEIAITVSASLSGEVGVAVGNILGGIAIQTVVLVLLDAVGMKEPVPLTYRAASLTLVIEGLLVVAVLIVAIMGTQLPPTLIRFRLGPDAVMIALLWVVGVWLVGRANNGLPWHDGQGDAPDTQAVDKGHATDKAEAEATAAGVSTTRAALVFGGAAVVTLLAGVALEQAGDALAGQIGLSGVLFGATVLAAATALPEVSTGLTSTRAGDYQLAISDIFGGNAFLPVLFLVATLVSGRAVLPAAQHTDIYLAGLGVLLTSVYLAGLIFRPKRMVLGMGLDSLAVLILYAVGTAGLFAIALA